MEQHTAIHFRCLCQCGAMLGLIFGALILLRPVTNRLLRPKHRVMLWFVGWYTGALVQFYDMLGAIRLLPVSLFGECDAAQYQVGGFRPMSQVFLDGYQQIA